MHYNLDFRDLRLKMLSDSYSVTSFLESDKEILILLRSERVSTYRGKWAAISGSLDEGKTPDDQAIVEIEEETGLSRKDLKLIKKGEPLVFYDETLGLRKTIYPYLFHIENRNMIRLDWEHNELKWIKPEDIDKYDAMPELKEALGRVLES